MTKQELCEDDQRKLKKCIDLLLKKFNSIDDFEKAKQELLEEIL